MENSYPGRGTSTGAAGTPAGVQEEPFDNRWFRERRSTTGYRRQSLRDFFNGSSFPHKRAAEPQDEGSSSNLFNLPHYPRPCHPTCLDKTQTRA